MARQCNKCSAPLTGLALKCPRCGSGDVQSATAIKIGYLLAPILLLGAAFLLF